MHYGHANALRQAKTLGDHLVVGVHSDEEISKHKGPPVMTLEERCEMVLACKWVDEVVPGAPYTTEMSYLDEYNCDFCVHGDDIVTSADGVDTYHLVKSAGRFRTVPRTTGVSTTDIVGRMLLLTSQHHKKYDDDRNARSSVGSEELLDLSQGPTSVSPYTGVSQFLPTSRKIIQFSEGRAPNPGDVVVYVIGTYDLFHNGHVKFLKMAKEQGDFLVVGVLPDHIVYEKKNGHGPIMNLHERVLSVLGCRYVDEVIIGAPWTVTKDLIDNMNVNLVVQGTVVDHAYEPDNDDPYEYPRSIGIYREVESQSTLTTSDILDRIIANRSVYLERNKRKQAKEIAELMSAQTDQ